MALREAHDKSKYLRASSSLRRVRVESEESSHDGDANHEEAHPDGSTGELKQLQDSLTRYYTPSNRRRSRVAQSAVLEQLEDASNESSQRCLKNGHSELKRENSWQMNGADRKRVTRSEQMCPLTVSVDEALGRCEGPSSGSRIVQSPYSSWKCAQMASSPHKRNDVLFDALSPYFSASSEKRRTFAKGEYAQLSGVRRRGRSRDSTSTQEQISPASAWSVERARTSPEQSSCESMLQPESSARHERLEADESCIPEHNGSAYEGGRRRRVLARTATWSGRYEDESEAIANYRQHHNKTHNTTTPHQTTRPSLAVRAQSTATEQSPVFSPKRLRSSLPRPNRTPSPKQSRRDRERAPSAKRIRTPKLPHTPTTSPDVQSSGGSDTSYTLRKATRAHLKREVASRRQASAASLVRKAKSRSTASQRHGLHPTANINRLKAVRNAPGNGRNMRHAVTGPSSQQESDIRQSAVRRLSSSHKVKHVNSLAFEKPAEPTESDLELYEAACDAARNKVAKTNNEEPESREGAEDREEGRDSVGVSYLKRIVVGGFSIDTWYSAPYPQEYSRLNTLFMCEFCMNYVKTEDTFRRHVVKCSLRHPPGTEVYRKDDVSVFEVDGNVSVTYCQNVCLLSKLFLDHKTLYYDVEPFLFYVLTRNDEEGYHFVGYFSKEKYSAQKYNLSCIMTLPCYQKQGFGRFLIDFSFLLSRREGMMGTPERPLSDLGRISYLNYWLSAVLEHLHHTLDHDQPKKMTIKSVARATGISIFDIVEAIEPLGMIQREDAQNMLCVNWTLVEKHWRRAKGNPRRIWIDETVLQWEPREYTPYSPTKDCRLRSPGAAPSSLSPTRQASMRGENHTPRVKKNVVKRKVQATSRKRLVFGNNKRCSKPTKTARSKREATVTLTDSEQEMEDMMRATPTSKNSCKVDSRARRSRNDKTDDDKTTTEGADGADEPLPTSTLRPSRKASEPQASRRDSRSTTALTRQARIRARRALRQHSFTSDSSDYETANVPLPSKRAPQKRKKRVARKRIQKKKMKIPSRDSSVDTVAMLDGEEVTSVVDLNDDSTMDSTIDSVLLIDHHSKVRDSSSDADGSTEAERWAESIGVSSSSPSLSCPPYTPPAVSNGSEVTEKSLEPMAVTNDEDADVTLNADHEKDLMEARDNEDRTSLSRCDVEVGASHEDELPPTLEADGDLPLWVRPLMDSPSPSPEPAVMEVSFTPCEQQLSQEAASTSSHSRTEMPQLRASASGGTESVYDGEDEDAPPRLSPNFAPMEVAEEGRSETETFSQWIDAMGCSQGTTDSSQEATEPIDNSPPRLARSNCEATPPKALLRTTSTANNNTCEMVNLGGDAGSEEDTSESEGVHTLLQRMRTGCGVRAVGEVATSALDRPPKAPAMLTQPEEHEGSSSFSDGHSSFAKKRTQPPLATTTAMYGQAQPSNVNEQSPITSVTTPLAASVGSVSSQQHFISSSPSCSLQKHTPTGATHQTEMCEPSPSSSVYLTSSNSVEQHPSPTPTPIRINSQSQSLEPPSFGSPTLSKCDTDPMSSTSRTTVPLSTSCKTTPVSVQATQQPPITQPQTGQRRASGKKDMSRCAKQQQQTAQQANSTSSSLMIAPRGAVQPTAAPVSSAVSPYMLPSPASHTPISHQLTSHSQPPTGYYQGNYGHAGGGSGTHYESQFYPGNFAGTATGTYPMNIPAMAKSHSVPAAAVAMHNSFSAYSYQTGMQPNRGGMLGGTGAGSAVTGSAPAGTSASAQSMMTAQCAAVQNANNAGTAAASSAPWRYAANGASSAPFSGGGFMDAFGGTVPPGGTNGQFPLPNQLYPQPYYPYLMPVRRND